MTCTVFVVPPGKKHVMYPRRHSSLYMKEQGDCPRVTSLGGPLAELGRASSFPMMSQRTRRRGTKRWQETRGPQRGSAGSAGWVSMWILQVGRWLRGNKWRGRGRGWRSALKWKLIFSNMFPKSPLCNFMPSEYTSALMHLDPAGLLQSTLLNVLHPWSQLYVLGALFFILLLKVLSDLQLILYNLSLFGPYSTFFWHDALVPQSRSHTLQTGYW